MSDTTVVLGAQGSVDSASARTRPLSTGAEWTFELLATYDRAIREIAVGEFGLDSYPNQIEVITSASRCSTPTRSSGLPIGYPHWSFGKEFIRNEHDVPHGRSAASPTRS